MRFAVVGNGKMAGDVLRQIAATKGAMPVLALGDPRRENAQSRLAAECGKVGAAYLETTRLDASDTVSALREADLDYIVSANNFLIFRGEALRLARRGIINFHNGPLPRYGGLNACSWALFNGESEHGVTWHLVDEGIDSGPVLAQRLFPVTPAETAIGLVAACIREGVSLFREILPGLMAGSLTPSRQDPSKRLYYGAKDRPCGGFLPWTAGVEAVARLARALSFAPMPNLFFRPELRWQGGEAFVEHMELDSRSQAQPGCVLDIGAGSIRIDLGEASVSCHDLRDRAGRPISPATAGLRLGTLLLPPPATG